MMSAGDQNYGSNPYHPPGAPLPPGQGGDPPHWLDRQFRNTPLILLILFGCCCGWIAAIVALVEVIIGKDPTAKKNATIVLVVGLILTVIGVGANVYLQMHPELLPQPGAVPGAPGAPGVPGP